MSSTISFLTPEERYEVYTIKAAERPHLLQWQDDEVEDDQRDDDETTALPLPLIDGCDLSGWRKEGLVPVSPFVQAALRVGIGCSLLRRDRQLPLLSTPCEQHPGQDLLKALSQPPETPVARVDCAYMSELVPFQKDRLVPRFALEWEAKRHEPVIIENVTTNWKAKEWTFDGLVERFGHVHWRFSDTHGEMMSLETYRKYLEGVEGQSDDAPLGIYDSEFGDPDSPTCVLVDEYTVPECFSGDLFESRSPHRPPYRWILMGPARSGTGLHIDPLWTNAWVTLLQGRKRWVLFPPDTDPNTIGMQDPQISSVIWFRDWYPQLRGKHGMVEVLQQSGETVWVPSGWPHLVLNLEATVAVTHNYASEWGPHLQRVWNQVQRDEPDFGRDWGLLEARSDLAERIDTTQDLNKATLL